MIKGIDTAAAISENAAKKLKELGYQFVGRYIVPPTGELKWKALTEIEAKIIRSVGLAILPIWETTAKRARSGAAAGAQDGLAAEKRASELGIPSGTVICFTVDYNAPESDYAAIQAYLRAAKWNIGKYKLGLYAPSAVLKEMKSVIDYGWQCYAWSGGWKADADAYQTAWQGDLLARELGEKLGFSIDLDEAKTLSGMWFPNDVTEDAFMWALSLGIVTDASEKNIALALWRYHCIFTEADDKKDSGLLT